MNRRSHRASASQGGRASRSPAARHRSSTSWRWKLRRASARLGRREGSPGHRGQQGRRPGHRPAARPARHDRSPGQSCPVPRRRGRGPTRRAGDRRASVGDRRNRRRVRTRGGRVPAGRARPARLPREQRGTLSRKAAVSMLTLKYANAFRADPALADAKVNAVTPALVVLGLSWPVLDRAVVTGRQAGRSARTQRRRGGPGRGSPGDRRRPGGSARPGRAERNRTAFGQVRQNMCGGVDEVRVADVGEHGPADVSVQVGKPRGVRRVARPRRGRARQRHSHRPGSRSVPRNRPAMRQLRR